MKRTDFMFAWCEPVSQQFDYLNLSFPEHSISSQDFILIKGFVRTRYRELHADGYQNMKRVTTSGSSILEWFSIFSSRNMAACLPCSLPSVRPCWERYKNRFCTIKLVSMTSRSCSSAVYVFQQSWTSFLGSVQMAHLSSGNKPLLDRKRKSVFCFAPLMIDTARSK